MSSKFSLNYQLNGSNSKSEEKESYVSSELAEDFCTDVVKALEDAGMKFEGKINLKIVKNYLRRKLDCSESYEDVLQNFITNILIHHKKHQNYIYTQKYFFRAAINNMNNFFNKNNKKNKNEISANEKINEDSDTEIIDLIAAKNTKQKNSVNFEIIESLKNFLHELKNNTNIAKHKEIFNYFYKLIKTQDEEKIEKVYTMKQKEVAESFFNINDAQYSKILKKIKKLYINYITLNLSTTTNNQIELLISILKDQNDKKMRTELYQLLIQKDPSQLNILNYIEHTILVNDQKNFDKGILLLTNYGIENRINFTEKIEKYQRKFNNNCK